MAKEFLSLPLIIYSLALDNANKDLERRLLTQDSLSLADGFVCKRN
jgi:hypothetical protein